MQKSFWWWQCSDMHIISLSPHLHNPFSLSLISLMVSVVVKHHVYFLTLWSTMFTSLLSSVSDYSEQKHHTETGSQSVSGCSEQKHHTETGSRSVSDYREQKYHTKTGSQSVSGYSEQPYSEHNKHKPPAYSPDNAIIQCDCPHSRQWCHANQSTKSIHTPIPLHLHPHPPSVRSILSSPVQNLLTISLASSTSEMSMGVSW